jgi:hypothetical protein
LTVLKDPTSGGTAGTIAEQFVLVQAITLEIDTAKALTTRIDTIRVQLETLEQQLGGEGDVSDLPAKIQQLDRAFAGLADSLVQQKPGGFYMWPVRLTTKLVYLANHVQSSDHAPTQQAHEAHAFLEKLLRVAILEYERLVSHDLADLNTQLGARGLSIVEP